jgi:hypothetical protein
VRYFEAEHISFSAIDPDGGALYDVKAPGLARLGQVRVSASRHREDATESWIAEELNRRILRFGAEIVTAALATPLELE